MVLLLVQLLVVVRLPHGAATSAAADGGGETA